MYAVTNIQSLWYSSVYSTTEKLEEIEKLTFTKVKNVELELRKKYVILKSQMPYLQQTTNYISSNQINKLSINSTPYVTLASGN